MSRKQQRPDNFVKRQRIVIAFCAAFILLCFVGMVNLAFFLIASPSSSNALCVTSPMMLWSTFSSISSSGRMPATNFR